MPSTGSAGDGYHSATTATRIAGEASGRGGAATPATFTRLMPMRRHLTPLLPLAAVAAIAAGCGDDDATTGGTSPTGPTPAVTGDGPVASTPSATAPPTDATAPPPQTTTTPPADGRDDEGGGSAEPPRDEPVRVPATFEIADGRLAPPAITVPPFLAIEVSVANPSGGEAVVVVRTPRPVTLTVPAGARAAARVPGQRAGVYEVTVDGRAAGQLVVGGEAGP